MTFKSLQVLRTNKPMRNKAGHPVAKGTRVVVIHVEDGKVLGRLSNKTRVEAPIASFDKTYRGRPKNGEAVAVKAKKPVKPVK